MRDARLLLLPVLAACGGAGASYPDRSDVNAAQAAWCDSLAKLNGAPGAWEHLAACKAAYPSSSGQYLRGMTTCFTKRREAGGDKGPDQSQTVAECHEEVTVNMRADDAAGREAVEARCARMERCEKVAVADCKAGFAKLESAQRAALTSAYNRGALHTIAECLESESCTADEDAAREACYKKVGDKLLWFPG